MSCSCRGRIAFHLLFILTAALVLGKETAAQCVVYRVVVSGEDPSGAGGQTVLVRVHTNKGKRIFEARTTPKDGHFRVAVGFDTFVSVHLFGAHNCSLRPAAVDVVLLADGSEKQAIKLSIEHDFALDSKTGEWHLRVPVTFAASSR